jgi:hypothetical protein
MFRTGMDLLAKKYHSNSYRCRRSIHRVILRIARICIVDVAPGNARDHSPPPQHNSSNDKDSGMATVTIIIIVIARAVFPSRRPLGRSPKERFESLQNADALC